MINAVLTTALMLWCCRSDIQCSIDGSNPPFSCALVIKQHYCLILVEYRSASTVGEYCSVFFINDLVFTLLTPRSSSWRMFVSFPTLFACLYALSGVAMMQIVSCPYVKTISPTKNGNSLPHYGMLVTVVHFYAFFNVIISN